MAGYIKLEKRRAELKDGEVFKTRHVEFQWFPIDAQPKCYVLDDATNCAWYPTLDYHFGPTPPEETP